MQCPQAQWTFFQINNVCKLMRLTQFIQKHNYVQTGFLKTDEVIAEQKCEIPACREKLEQSQLLLSFLKMTTVEDQQTKMGCRQFLSMI